jgi:hypothetical protein
MTTALAHAAGPRQSPFAGADVCREAGLVLPDGTARPVFDDDMWDFTEVAGLPNQMAKVNRRFDFAAITRGDWRLVAKEQVMAMLAPRHEAVIVLPHAYRTPLHLTTAFARLAELTRLLNWLDAQDVASLAGIDDERCEEWMAHRRYLLDENGNVAGERSPATRRAAAQAVADLVTHRELFTADTVAAGLRPWRGALPRSSPRCRTEPARTRPRRSATASCSRCWPPPST